MGDIQLMLVNFNLDKAIQKHKSLLDDMSVIKIVDIGGLDIDTVLTKSSLVSVQGAVLVYSVTARESFLLLEGLRKRIHTYKGDSRFPLFIVGNKVDLGANRLVSTEEGRMLARKWGCGFIETAATLKDDPRIIDCFELLIKEMEHMYTLAAFSNLNRHGYLTKAGNKFKSRNRRFFMLHDNVMSYSNEPNQHIKVTVFREAGWE